MNSNSNIFSAQSRAGLSQADLAGDPMAQFALWFQRVLDERLPEPNAMTLATSTPDGIPSARIVLLKGYDQNGFVFFTNYDSQKGRELAVNPQVALVLFWPTLERQVRVVGTVSKIGRRESEEYFHTRPLGSQLGAWASRQSQVLQSREELESKVREVATRFAGELVPLPPNWGGYCVRPSTIEFWQARADRLHDRFRYSRQSNGSWIIERLSP